MPQLDGLRTLAVAAVIAQHYRVFIGSAGYGVHLFFVLSGFLITGILLAERDNVEQMGITRVRAFKQFYVRRALRIFPLYYFVVLSCIVLDVTYAREYAPWLLTYTINLKMAAQGWYVDNFAHFWSLAVEEQYYLAWPWIILLVPRRWLAPAALVAIAVGPLFRLYAAILAGPEPSGTLWLTSYIATPAALDHLGMGSLLAILVRSDFATRLQRWMRFAIPVGAFAALLVFQVGTSGRLHLVVMDTLAAVFFAWLIYTASRGFGGVTGRILAAAPIVFLGRISYGLYVYHPLIPLAVIKTGQRFGWVVPEGVWVTALLYTSLTVIAATISWYVLERPMNQLKRRFPYVGTREESKQPSRELQPT